MTARQLREAAQRIADSSPDHYDCEKMELGMCLGAPMQQSSLTMDDLLIAMRQLELKRPNVSFYERQ